MHQDIHLKLYMHLLLIFISHNPWDAHAVADRFVILERGKVVFDAPKGDMTADQFVAHLHNFAKK